MTKLPKLRINPGIIAALLEIAFFGACAWSARNAPQFAIIAAGILFVLMGVPALGMGKDGRCLGTMILISGVLMLFVGIIM